MNCPICKQTLRTSQKDPNYALCDNCRKKFRLPEAPKPSQTFSNIPPSHIREAREQEMRQAYDELLAIGQEEKKSKFSFFKRSK